MKATEAKDLVIGAIYSDIMNLNERSTLLKYKGPYRRRLQFEYVGGAKSYKPNKRGSIDFSRVGGGFYELTPSEIEQYLPKEKP